MRTPLLRFVPIAALALGVSACPPDDQRTDTLDPATAGQALTEETKAQLDSGNAAFRAADLERALVHFERVTELAPEDATGWFGLFMTYEAMGDKAAADSVLAVARSIAPGASLIRDTLETP